MPNKIETSFSGCGVHTEDFGFESAGGELRDQNIAWDHSPVTWQVTNAPDDVSLAECKRIMHRAFRVWMQRSSLNAREVSDDKNADISISFKSPESVPQLGDNMAIAFYPDAPSNSGQVIFNSKQDWDITILNRDGTEPQLFCYAVHEIGHAIGIKQHGNPTFDVMQADPANWPGQLSNIDINFVQSIYETMEGLNA